MQTNVMAYPAVPLIAGARFGKAAAEPDVVVQLLGLLSCLVGSLVLQFLCFFCSLVVLALFVSSVWPSSAARSSVAHRRGRMGVIRPDCVRTLRSFLFLYFILGPFVVDNPKVGTHCRTPLSGLSYRKYTKRIA